MFNLKKKIYLINDSFYNFVYFVTKYPDYTIYIYIYIFVNIYIYKSDLVFNLSTCRVLLTCICKIWIADYVRNLSFRFCLFDRKNYISLKEEDEEERWVT